MPPLPLHGLGGAAGAAQERLGVAARGREGGAHAGRGDDRLERQRARHHGADPLGDPQRRLGVAHAEAQRAEALLLDAAEHVGGAQRGLHAAGGLGEHAVARVAAEAGGDRGQVVEVDHDRGDRDLPVGEQRAEPVHEHVARGQAGEAVAQRVGQLPAPGVEAARHAQQLHDGAVLLHGSDAGLGNERRPVGAQQPVAHLRRAGCRRRGWCPPGARARPSCGRPGRRGRPPGGSARLPRRTRSRDLARAARRGRRGCRRA